MRKNLVTTFILIIIGILIYSSNDLFPTTATFGDGEIVSLQNPFIGGGLGFVKLNTTDKQLYASPSYLGTDGPIAKFIIKKDLNSIIRKYHVL